MKKEGACLVIPVRLESERFPNKPLTIYNGKTLLENSISIAKKLNFINKIVVASGNDDIRIKEICKKNKVDFLYINDEVSCGTERVYHIWKNKEYKNYEFYMVLPVDEPEIQPDEINKVWKEHFLTFKDNYRISTFYCDFYSKEDLIDIKSCKIITDKSDNILYTSRAVIPITKSGDIADLSIYKKHVGIFIFPNKLLEDHKLKIWTKNILSNLEGLEQNMFLGFNFNCFKINHIGFGIDIKEQIKILEERVKNE